MSDTPDQKDRDAQAVGRQTGDAAIERSRTAAAGREFLNAVGGDIRRLGGKLTAGAAGVRQNLAAARLRRSLAAARQRQEALSRRRSRRGWVRTSGRVARRFVVG